METWWWNDSASTVVCKKRRLWKAQRKGISGCQESIQACYVVKKAAQEKVRCIKECDTRIFKITKQMKRGNQDVVGEKCVLNDNDKLSFDTNAKNVAWKEFYDQLLNQEFDWDQSSLSVAHPVISPAFHVTVNMV